MASSGEGASAEETTRTASVEELSAPQVDRTEYRIRPGDSLWTIARRHGVSVTELKAQNALSTNRIYAGQLIQVPATR